MSLTGFQIGSGASGPRNPVPAVGGALVETIALTNSSGGVLTDVQVSVGLFNFLDGDIPSGSIPEIRVSGGAALADQQVDQEVFFSSNALQQCTMHCVVPSLASGTTNFDVWRVTGSQSHTAGIAWSDILAFNSNAFNWTIQFEDDQGNVWSADLRTAGNGGTINGHSDTGPSNYGFFSRGPKECTWRVAMPMMNGATPHPILRGEFHVYAQTKGGVLLAPKVEPTIFNGSATKENGSYLLRNVYIYKDGQSTSTAAWKREFVAPVATLTVSTPTGANSPTNSWDISTSAGVLNTVYRGRPLVVPGKGAICLHTYTNTSSMAGCVPATENSICDSQSPSGAGNLTLNGHIVVGGTVKMQAVGGRFMRVAFISASNNSGVTLTITGTTISGADTEAVTGPNNSITYATKDWITITQIARSGSVSNLKVGTLGFNTGSTTASGSWGVYGSFIPQGGWLSVGLLEYSSGAPARWFPVYSAARLAASPVMTHWNFTKTGSLSSEVASNISDLDALPNAGAWGYTKDYNPFYWTTDPGSFGYHKLHQLREPNTGGRSEIAVMAGWACYHVQQQTADSWRQFIDVEEGSFSYKRHMMDASTGLPVNPNDHPTFQRADAVFFDNYNSDDTNFTATSWSFWVTQAAHRGEWNQGGYLFTRRLSFMLMLQYAAIYSWSEAQSLSGNAYDRQYMDLETRGVAWRMRDFMNAVSFTPATLYNTVVLARSVLTSLINAMTSKAYSQYVIPGPDLNGWYSDAVATTPTKGDFHFINPGGDNTIVAMWMHFHCMPPMALAYRRGVLDTNGQNFFDWLSDLMVGLIGYTSVLHPAYIGMAPWWKDIVTNPKTITQSWSYVQDPTNWPTSSTPEFWNNLVSNSVSITGDATGIGNSVTLTATTDIFYSDHIGARIVKLASADRAATRQGIARITAYTSAKIVTAIIVTGFNNNSAFADWMLGIPDPQVSTRGTLRYMVGATFDEGYDSNIASLWYAALSAAQALPAQASAAAAAQASLTTWLDTDSVTSPIPFAWDNYPYQIQAP